MQGNLQGREEVPSAKCQETTEERDGLKPTPAKREEGTDLKGPPLGGEEMRRKGLN